MADPVKIHYRFILSETKCKEFDVRLCPNTLSLIPEKQDTLPEWTKLEFHQCSNCPLKSDWHPHCPIAANLVAVIDFCKDMLSYQEVEMEIITENRTYRKRTALQHALSSLIGVYMVTSGCPILDKLRPMVKTHLPFPSLQETIYRSTSMYMLAQYFVFKKGREPDWNMLHLTEIYKKVQIVNDCFRKRIVAEHTEDAGLNALFHLNTHAKFTNMMLLEQELHDLAKLFMPYLED